eukprot:349863-Alexandrium_andersonii.AAC.1
MQLGGSPRGPTGSGSSTSGPPPESPAARAERRTCVLCLSLAYSNPGDLCDACAAAVGAVRCLNALFLSDDERRELSGILGAV